MPLLTRIVGVPLAVEISPGAIRDLASLLADHRISSGGDVAVVVGPGQGERLAVIAKSSLPSAHVLRTRGGTIETAQALSAELRQGYHDAVVGIGGGRILDTVKWAATNTGIPMVSVATNLAHDGIASPVASLEQGGRKGSFGVLMPLAIIVDLEVVIRSPARMRRSGIGDVVSNLTALADWELAASVRGETLDGVAMSLARTAALAVIGARGSVDDQLFLKTLAEGLVLSGLAMAVAGSSRPCSGGEHEIIHACERLFPGVANHGELAAIGTVCTSFLSGDLTLASDVERCFARHGLPRLPKDIGLTHEDFCRVLLHAPNTRPDRHTVLEELGLTEAQAFARLMEVEEWVALQDEGER